MTSPWILRDAFGFGTQVWKATLFSGRIQLDPVGKASRPLGKGEVISICIYEYIHIGYNTCSLIFCRTFKARRIEATCIRTGWSWSCYSSSCSSFSRLLAWARLTPGERLGRPVWLPKLSPQRMRHTATLLGRSCWSASPAPTTHVACLFIVFFIILPSGMQPAPCGPIGCYGSSGIRAAPSLATTQVLKHTFSIHILRAGPAGRLWFQDLLDTIQQSITENIHIKVAQDTQTTYPQRGCQRHHRSLASILT